MDFVGLITGGADLVKSIIDSDKAEQNARIRKKATEAKQSARKLKERAESELNNGEPKTPERWAKLEEARRQAEDSMDKMDAMIERHR